MKRKVKRNIYFDDSGGPSPYLVIKTYQTKQYHIGSFSTFGNAEQALNDFIDDPESYIEFIGMDRAKKTPEWITQTKSGTYSASGIHDDHRYYLGTFAELQGAIDIRKKFKKNPKKIIEIIEKQHKRDLPKNIYFYAKNIHNPYRVFKMYKKKQYDLGYFPTIEIAEHVLAEFNANPEKWKPFLTMGS
jgi:hypothetical protein